MPEIQYTTEEQIEAMRSELKRARLKAESSGVLLPKNRVKNMIVRIFIVLFLIIIILLLLIAGSVLTAKEKGETASIFGYSLYTMETGNMSPTLDVGAVILVKTPENSNALKMGDIILYKSISGSVAIQRITEVITEENGSVSYRTKSDNSESAEINLVTPDQVISVFIIKIPLT